jgi:hypothetical protein
MQSLKYTKIRNKGYGQRWKDFKIHYVGQRPKLIRDDGAFSSGKSLLEALATKFERFELVITPEESRIQGNGSGPRICVAVSELQKMNSGLFTQKKHVTQQAVAHLLSSLFPGEFDKVAAPPSAAVTPPAMAEPSPAELPSPTPSPVTSLPSVQPSAENDRKRPARKKLKGRISLKELRRLARELKKRIETHKAEDGWRSFLRQNILAIQRGYIELIPKTDLKLSDDSYPGFFMITYDGYLDIPEIKTPVTELVSYDEETKTHAWSPEIAGAIARVESYLESVTALGDDLCKKVKETRRIKLPAIKPRGIIFAGHMAQFKGNRRARKAFERLNAASPNLTIVTYDELLTRLRNHIAALRGSKEKKK